MLQIEKTENRDSFVRRVKKIFFLLGNGGYNLIYIYTHTISPSYRLAAITSDKLSSLSSLRKEKRLKKWWQIERVQYLHQQGFVNCMLAVQNTQVLNAAGGSGTGSRFGQVVNRRHLP